MSKSGVLSSKFNMSLGFIPVLIAIIAGEFLAQSTAIYLGASVGVFYIAAVSWKKEPHLPLLILYTNTGMLLLLAVTTLFLSAGCPSAMFPLTLEISALIPVWVLYLNRKHILSYQVRPSKRCNKQLFVQGAQSAIVAARVAVIFGGLHFAVILVSILIDYPLSSTARLILFRICPPTLFALTIIFNQFGIYYFNKIMKRAAFIPIVNLKGDVIGKSLAVDALKRKSSYIHPVIRIAIISQGLLFLLPRPQSCIFDKEKTDTLLEGYLLYGESLQQGINRILQEAFSKVPKEKCRFSIMYHFEKEETNRLIYLFLLELKDDSILCNKQFEGGKLWTFQQMEDNLEKDFFSSCFEYEFEHLKSAIYTREKYKES